VKQRARVKHRGKKPEKGERNDRGPWTDNRVRRKFVIGITQDRPLRRYNSPCRMRSQGTERLIVFWYFGYGSNMALGALLAKGVKPLRSERAVLQGWYVRFNVQHFFRHEGGVGNIEPTDKPSVVWGVLHLCEDEHLKLLDAAEAYPHGYDRIEVKVLTDRGEQLAIAYVGKPSFINNECLPTQRYLNILIEGATAALLDPAYIESLRHHPVLQKREVPTRYVPPLGEYPVFTASTLAKHALYTALDGFVFDMSKARWHHRFLHSTFGGKDMTLFHLNRMGGTKTCEALADIKHAQLTPAQRQYLDEYLQAYALEYAFVGYFCYEYGFLVPRGSFLVPRGSSSDLGIEETATPN
jgi:gamma-glutamylcyclotransferase (GGCT)/AIG2-like uncharacterized protein YtfP